MTWNELNQHPLIDDMLPDMLGSAWTDLIDMDGDNDELFNCQALDWVIAALEETAMDLPADHDAEIVEHQRLIKELKEV